MPVAVFTASSSEASPLSSIALRVTTLADYGVSLGASFMPVADDISSTV